MTDELTLRPEPVVNAAKLGGLVAAVVVAIAAVIALVLAGRWTDINALGTTLGAFFGALIALAAYVAPVWQAYKARAKVTPLVDPQTAAGTQLVPIQIPDAVPPPQQPIAEKHIDTRTPGYAAHAAPDDQDA